MRQKFREKRFAGFLLLGLAAVAIFTLVVMALWNAILVPVVHVGAVTFWQAAGILILSKILFGGFRGGGRWGNHRRNLWKQELHDKWGNMSTEDRDKLKQEWRQRCNRWKSGRFDNQQSAADPGTV